MNRCCRFVLIIGLLLLALGVPVDAGEKDQIYQKYYSRAHDLMFMGKPAEAIEVTEKMLRLAIQRGRTQTLRGRIFLSDGQMEKAVASFTAALKLDPKDTDALGGRKDCWIEARQFEKAIDDIDQILDISQDPPSRIWLYRVRGNCHRELANYPAAIDDFMKAFHTAVEAEPGEDYPTMVRVDFVHAPRHYLEVAECYRLAGDLDKAIEAASTLIELIEHNPHEAWKGEGLDDVGRYARGLLALRKNDLQSALDDFTKLASLKTFKGIDSERLRGRFQRSRILQIQGKYDQAIAAYCEVDKLTDLDYTEYPEDLAALLQLRADCFHNRAQCRLKTENAAQAAKELATLTGFLAGETLRDNQLLLARCYHIQGGAQNCERAATVLTTLLERQPDDAAARRLLASVRISEDNYAEAAKQYEHILERDPKNASTYAQLSLLQWLLPDYDTARQRIAAIELRAKKTLFPQYITPKVEEGIKAINNGECDKAEQLFTEALEEDPGNAEAYFQRGMCHAKGGDRDEAINDFARAAKAQVDYVKPFLSNAVHAHRQAGNDLHAFLFAEALDSNTVPDNDPVSFAENVRRVRTDRQEWGIGQLDRILLRRPRLADACCYRGILKEDLTQTPEALADYNRALTLDPLHADALYRLAVMAAAANQTAKSLQLLSQCLLADPQHVDALSLRGQSYAKLGAWQNALDDLRTAADAGRRHAQEHEDNPSIQLAQLERELAYARLRFQTAVTLSDYEQIRKAANRILRQLQQLDDGSALKDPTAVKTETIVWYVLSEWRKRLLSGEAFSLSEIHQDSSSYAKELAEPLGQPIKADSPWPIPLVAFLIGQITEQDLLAVAQAGSPDRLCQAWCIIGEYCHLMGDTKNAIEAFERAAGSESQCFERQVAQARLQQLKQAESMSPLVACHVEPYSGRLHVEKTDIAFEGCPLPLRFERYYNSGSHVEGTLGIDWTHNYEVRLQPVEGQDAIALLGPGRTIRLFDQTQDGFAESAGKRGRIKSTPEGWIVMTPLEPEMLFSKDDGSLLRIRDNWGNGLRFTYDDGKLSEITGPFDQTITFLYDSAGHISWAGASNGAGVTFRYDSKGQLICVRRGSVQEQYQYPDEDNRLMHIQADDYTWSVRFDKQGRVSRMTDALSQEFAYTYDTSKDGFDIFVETNAQTHSRTERRYSHTRGVELEIDPDKVQTRREVDPRTGLLRSITDGNGNVTQFQWDDRGRLSRIIDPLEHQTAFAYVGKSPLPKTVTYPGGRQATYTYDPAGHLKTITDTAQEGTCSIRYDAMGRVVERTEWGHVTRKYRYGENWTPTQVLDGSDHAILDSRNIESGGDHLGMKQALKHAMDVHDVESGQILSVGNNTITGTYDPAGNLTEVIFPTGLKAQMTYTPAGRLRTLSRDGKRIKAFERDTNGNVISEETHGRETRYNYDNLNRLAEQTTGETQRRFTYNDSGQLASVVENGREIKGYDYDEKGRFRKVRSSGATVEYDYALTDDADGRNTIQLGGLKVEHVYEDGRLVAVEASHFGRIEFDSDKDVSVVRFPNGVTETHTTDPVKRSITLAVAHEGEKLYRQNTMLDLKGNVAARDMSLGDYKIREFLKYDGQDQLIEYQKSTSEEPLPQKVTYAYDAWGNMVTSHLGTIKVQRDGTVKGANGNGNEDSMREYKWDPWGNLVFRCEPTSTRDFTFDAFDRLVKIRDEYYGKDLASFAYDEGNLMTMRQVDEQTTFFIYDGFNPIAEVTEAPDGVTLLLKRFFLYGPGMDYVLGMATFEGGDPKVYFFHRNERNDVVLVTDAEGKEAASYQYGPWGRVSRFRPEEDTFEHSVESPFRFRGCLFDPTTGMTYMRRRFYDPDLGRFISRDPVAGNLHDPITTNPYAYARNNPYRFGDPLGTQAGPSMGDLANEGQSASSPSAPAGTAHMERMWFKYNQAMPKLSTAMAWTGRKDTNHLSGTIEGTILDTMASMASAAVGDQGAADYLITDWSKGDPIRLSQNEWTNVNFKTERVRQPRVNKLAGRIDKAFSVGKLAISLVDIKARQNAGLISAEEADDAYLTEIIGAGLGELVSATEAATSASGPAGVALTLMTNWATDEVKEAVKQGRAAERAFANEEVAKMNQETGNFVLVRQRIAAIRALLQEDEEEPLLEARRLCWNLETFIWETTGMGDAGMDQQYDLVGKLKDQVEAKLAEARRRKRQRFEQEMAELQKQRNGLEPDVARVTLDNALDGMETSERDLMAENVQKWTGQTDAVAGEDQDDWTDDPLGDIVTEMAKTDDPLAALNQPKTGKAGMDSVINKVIEGDRSQVSFHDLDAVIEQEEELAARLAEEGPMTRNRLFDAAAQNDADTIANLAGNGMDIDARANGVTPLMLASHYGSYASAEALLKAGANPNAKNAGDQGWTPLHYAAAKNHKRVTDLLSRHGARPTADDKKHMPGYYMYYLHKDAQLADKLGFGKPLADQRRHQRNRENFNELMQALATGMQAGVSAGMQNYQPPSQAEIWADDDDTSALSRNELNQLVGAMNSGVPEDPGARGDPTVTLLWTHSGSSRPEGPDIDIWVTDPEGRTVSTSRGTPPVSADNGTFDFDDRGGWGTRDGDNGKGPERVFWTQGKAPRGTYEYGVRFYRGDGTANYTVRVYRNGVLLATKSGTLKRENEEQTLGTFENR